MLDATVTEEFTFQPVASELCFRDRSQLNFLVDVIVLKKCRHHSESVVWCKLC